jgi:NAD+ synthase (glutamine-hydrolysing)
MPGFGTTSRTKGNAGRLCEGLGIEMGVADITATVRSHFADLGRDESVRDVTYENAQARARTFFLMDRANEIGALVVGTGDLSEEALGWCTYNGDHMSMYGVNAGVPKTLIRDIARWYAVEKCSAEAKEALLDILDTPVSPELLPATAGGEIAQKTEDKVGPYELHDFFLYHFAKRGADGGKIRALALATFGGAYGEAEVDKWLGTFMRRFRTQQFKRSCSPDGPQVGPVSLSPRGGWTMPSDLG